MTPIPFYAFSPEEGPRAMHSVGKCQKCVPDVVALASL